MNYDKVESELRAVTIAYRTLWEYDMDASLNELVCRSACYLVNGTCVPVLVAEEMVRAICNRLVPQMAEDVREGIIRDCAAWLCHADDIFNPCDPEELPPF